MNLYMSAYMSTSYEFAYIKSGEEQRKRVQSLYTYLKQLNTTLKRLKRH